jgi:hypothetical protein
MAVRAPANSRSPTRSGGVPVRAVNLTRAFHWMATSSGLVPSRSHASTNQAWASAQWRPGLRRRCDPLRPDGLSVHHLHIVTSRPTRRCRTRPDSPPSRGRAAGSDRHTQTPAGRVAPDATLTADDPRYGRVSVRAWHRLHPQLQGRGRWPGPLPPIVRGSVIEVVVEHLPRPTGRALRTLWLWWSGPGTPDLDVCWRAYLRRFDLEHTFRFIKRALGWTTPALRTPEQADRWTWLVVAAYTQLRLARGLVADQRLPWQRPCEPARLSPSRVRRGFRLLEPLLGTPASPPRSRTAGGVPRAPDALRGPATRCQEGRVRGFIAR